METTRRDVFRIFGGAIVASIVPWKAVAKTPSIPTLNLAIEKTVVEAGTRRLRCRWTVELAEDIKNMHGIDIANELIENE